MKITATEIPKFRYIDDIKRFLDKLQVDIDLSGKLLVQQQKLLANTFKVCTPLNAAMVFNVTPSDPKEQRKTLRRLKTKIDPSLTKVVVPNMKKLESQYNLAEDLYEKHRVVESVETTLSISFPDRRGEQYNATMTQIKAMKAKIAEQLKSCLEFLNEVAEKHVPKQFTQYTDTVANLVSDHVIFKESHSFLYVSVDPEGNLLFTNYLMLQDVANDEGDVASHLYISVQWTVSNDPSVHVELNHEFEVPNKLLGSGTEVGSVGEAIKAISDMLELENFSTALGVVPLALQLKVDPTSLNPQMFSYRDFIGKVLVDERTISFKLRKEASSPATVAEIAAQLYKELKGLLKTKNVRLTMKQNKVAGIYVITFNIVKIAEGGELSMYDLEFLRDKFGLNSQALRKIGNIINQESSQAEEERKATPVSNDLAELTRRSQEEKKQQMKKTDEGRKDPKE